MITVVIALLILMVVNNTTFGLWLNSTRIDSNGTVEIFDKPIWGTFWWMLSMVLVAICRPRIWISWKYWDRWCFISSILTVVNDTLLNIGFIHLPLSLWYLLFNSESAWNLVWQRLLFKKKFVWQVYLALCLMVSGLAWICIAALTLQQQPTESNKNTSNDLIIGIFTTLGGALTISLASASQEKWMSHMEGEAASVKVQILVSRTGVIASLIMGLLVLPVAQSIHYEDTLNTFDWYAHGTTRFYVCMVLSLLFTCLINVAWTVLVGTASSSLMGPTRILSLPFIWAAQLILKASDVSSNENDGEPWLNPFSYHQLAASLLFVIGWAYFYKYWDSSTNINSPDIMTTTSTFTNTNKNTNPTSPDTTSKLISNRKGFNEIEIQTI
jgi:drug/metabolite transporter (DMT)-like permease